VRSGRAVDELDGAISADGLVFGTYLHGLFDNEVVRDSLLAWLKSRRARIERREPSVAPPNRDNAINADPHERWADVLDAVLDVQALFESIGINGLSGGRR